MDHFDVIVYGATGYTGRLICQELARKNISFAVAGRDHAKLTALGQSVMANARPISDRPGSPRLSGSTPGSGATRHRSRGRDRSG